jgi:hypothetical protein
MSRIWLLLHFLGFIGWIGGGLTLMVVSIASKHETRAALGAVARAQAAVQRRSSRRARCWWCSRD